MKKLVGPEFESARVALQGDMGDKHNGAFVFKSPLNFGILRVVASSGEGWDHVSVSLTMRCPLWEEMEWIKRMFFKDSEIAYQLHVTPKDHINNHPYTLHLWRPHNKEIPLPPVSFV